MAEAVSTPANPGDTTRNETMMPTTLFDELKETIYFDITEERTKPETLVRYQGRKYFEKGSGK
jgi:hypothetical protein